MGERCAWEEWATTVGQMAERHITEITNAIEDQATATSFKNFFTELQIKCRYCNNPKPSRRISSTTHNNRTSVQRTIRRLPI
ncbi:MAG: hypothetical protein FWF57_06080 [Defluviitaleaceae bacterium]|nr:hypothetical protein [Defluviitaleaceae bacterium]